MRFANAFANAPMTLPSIPQLFTSTVFPTKDLETFVEPIAKAGIPSVAVVNNAWIPLWLSQGKHAEPPGTFDAMISGDLDAKAISDRAIAWLERHRDDRFVLYLHYLDAHTPTKPPKEYVARFADPSYAGKIGDTFTHPEDAEASRFDAADRAKVAAIYDAAIRYVDDQIGRVLETLEKQGELERTVVVVDRGPRRGALGPRPTSSTARRCTTSSCTSRSSCARPAPPRRAPWSSARCA